MQVGLPGTVVLRVTTTELGHVGFGYNVVERLLPFPGVVFGRTGVGKVVALIVVVKGLASVVAGSVPVAGVFLMELLPRCGTVVVLT